MFDWFQVFLYFATWIEQIQENIHDFCCQEKIIFEKETNSGI